VSLSHSNTGFPDEYLTAARALAAKAKGLRVPVLVYFTRNTVGVSTRSGSPSKFACAVGVAWPADPVANDTMTAAMKECNLYKAAASVDENTTAARVLDGIPRRANVCKIWRVNFLCAPAGR
jgi:hypothetical protein